MSDELIDAAAHYDVKCARCGVTVSTEWAFIEEGDAWGCPRCWHRCEEKELRDEIDRLRTALERIAGEPAEYYANIARSALRTERGAGQIDANTLEVGKRHAVKLTGEMSGVAGAVTITERGEGIVRPEWKDGGSVPTVFVQTGAWFRCSQCGQEMEHTEIDAHLAQHGLVPLTHPKATPAHE